jgi:hypothetical protein
MDDLIKDVEDRIKSLRQVTKILKDWKKISSQGDFGRLQRIYKKAKKSIDKIEDRVIKEKFQSWLRDAEVTLRKTKEEARYSFGKELAKLLEKEGMTLLGRYPRLSVGPYGIEVDFERGRARILFGHDPIKDNLPLSPQRIVKELIALRKSMESRWDPQKFIDRLFEAYLTVLKLKGRNLGERVPIMEVLQHLVFLLQGPNFKSDPRRENFRGFGRAQLAMMIYQARSSGVLARKRYALQLTTATFDATRRRENFLWIPDNMRGEGSTYAFLSFKDRGGTLL